MASSGLNKKRILVTDIELDFSRDIANALVSEGALVFILVKECRAMQQVLEGFPQLTPILLDICKEKGEETARKLLLSLPTIDHFINVSGDSALNIISQSYTNAKIHEVSDTNAKAIISKMNESGGRSLIFNVSFGNQNIMSKLKANLDPRFTNSKTAQISSNLRLSLKKMFSNNGESSASSSKQKMTSTSLTTSTPSPTTPAGASNTNPATHFAAVAATLSQNGSTSADAGTATTSNSSTSRSTPTPGNSRVQSLQERNNKIRQCVLKLQKQCAKKWKKAEKRIAKQQQSALKSLHKEIDKSKKIEKANIIKQISDANASTQSRAGALSADTANKIIEARENRADKEVEKHAQKRLEQETSKLLENKDKELTESHEKIYKKMVDREINEFNRIKSKYLV